MDWNLNERKTGRNMFILIRSIMWAFIVYKWGDWRNWRQYQASILYVIAADFLYNFLCYRYSMWEYPPNLIFSTHTATSLFYSLTIHPCVLILFLGKYPNGKKRQTFWIALWVLVYAVIEWIEFQMGVIVYHHGWNFFWSVVLMCIALPMVRLHQQKPLWAYGASAVVVTLLLSLFHVPFSK